MKDSRLFQILYCLLEREQVTAPELAEQFEVSVRTIYRDIDALSAAGIPVYAEAGRGGGIRLMDGYSLDKAIFSEAEKETILAALQSLAAAENTGGEVLKKLSALFHMQTESWFEIDFSRWGMVPGEQSKFELLKSAVIQHREVRIVYAGTNGSHTTRRIQPLKLLCKSGAWYVKAYCMEKEDFRIFKISRIMELSLLEETFLPMMYPEEHGIRETDLRDIILRFSADAAYRVYDEFDASQIERQEDGDLIARAKMPEDAWLTGYLLSFGTQVEVIEPAYLRRVLAEQARLIYEKNRDC